MTTMLNSISQTTTRQASLVKLILQQTSQTLEAYTAKSRRKVIVHSALIAVAERHPNWADVGFDEHFITHRGAEVMARYFENGQLPNPNALAEAWSGQYRWNRITNQEAQSRFIHIAEDFVYILSTEAA